MASRRGSRRGGSLAPASSRGGSGRIQRNRRSRQAPSRYGQIPEPDRNDPAVEEPQDEESENDEAEPSEYSQTLSSRHEPHTPRNSNPSTVYQQSPIPIPTSLSSSTPRSHSTSNPPGAISLDTMRELLRSQEQGIVERVVLQLRSQSTIPIPPTQPQVNQPQPAITRQPEFDPTLNRIQELEKELTQLHAERGRRLTAAQAPRESGMYSPTQPQLGQQSESASESVESVELLFPGVERSTLAQIIENRFKPTNIYRLLATEKERAETQRVINIGGIEFEQTERDGKESEYRMSSFFKAWAAYSGILVKLAPYGLQGELATALFIYTMSLYDLLEKYTWDGVKAYHFQFHRKRVASGKTIFFPQAWRQLDSELIASKCFAHPAPRNIWNQSITRTAPPPYRQPEIGAREHNFPTTQSYLQERRPGFRSTFGAGRLPAARSETTQIAQQACRNWNYRECYTTNCHRQHTCIICNNNHKSVQCPQATSLVPASSRTNRLNSR